MNLKFNYRATGEEHGRNGVLVGAPYRHPSTTVVTGTLTFLYDHQGNGHIIRLRPGVAFCFRKFHGLIADLVRGAWGRFVRQQNLRIIGETADLNEFLFGSERNNLAIVRPVLLDIQRGRCFYCNGRISGATAHVDHFVAWSRYPVDLAHNFVLVDGRCNGYKRDRLPACDHLAAWTERNAKYGVQIADALEESGVIAELSHSVSRQPSLLDQDPIGVVARRRTVLPSSQTKLHNATDQQFLQAVLMPALPTASARDPSRRIRRSIKNSTTLAKSTSRTGRTTSRNCLFDRSYGLSGSFCPRVLRAVNHRVDIQRPSATV